VRGGQCARDRRGVRGWARAGDTKAEVMVGRGPRVPARAELGLDTSGVGAERGQRRYGGPWWDQGHVSSQHQPGLPCTSWGSSRAMSLQDPSGEFLAISSPFFLCRCCSSVLLPEQQQQQPPAHRVCPAQPGCLSPLLWGGWPAMVPHFSSQ